MQALSLIHIWLLNQRAADDGAVLQHVVQIDQVAVVHVLVKVVGIVEVDQALLMRLYDCLLYTSNSCGRASWGIRCVRCCWLRFPI